MSGLVASQTKIFTFIQGVRVAPLGRIPPDLLRVEVSSQTEIWASLSDLFMSFTAACLKSLLGSSCN